MYVFNNEPFMNTVRIYYDFPFKFSFGTTTLDMKIGIVKLNSIKNLLTY